MEATKENVIKVTEEFLSKKFEGKSGKKLRDQFLTRSVEDWREHIGPQACENLENVFDDDFSRYVPEVPQGPWLQDVLFSIVVDVVVKKIIEVYREELALLETSTLASLASS